METKTFRSSTHVVEIMLDKGSWEITVSLGGKVVLDQLTAKSQPSELAVDYLLKDSHVSGIDSSAVYYAVREIGIRARNGRITP